MLLSCLLSLVFIDSLPGLTTVAFAHILPSPSLSPASSSPPPKFKNAYAAKPKSGLLAPDASVARQQARASAAVAPLPLDAGAYEMTSLPAQLTAVEAPHVIDVIQMDAGAEGGKAGQVGGRNVTIGGEGGKEEDTNSHSVVVDVLQGAEHGVTSATAGDGARGVEGVASENANTVGGEEGHTFFDAAGSPAKESSEGDEGAAPPAAASASAAQGMEGKRALGGENGGGNDTENDNDNDDEEGDDDDDLDSVGTDSSMGFDPSVSLKRRLALSQFHHLVTQLRQRATAAMEAALQRDRLMAAAAAGNRDTDDDMDGNNGGCNEVWKSPSASPFNSCSSSPMGRFGGDFSPSPSPFLDGASSLLLPCSSPSPSIAGSRRSSTGNRSEAQLMAMVVRRTAGLSEMVQLLTELNMEGKVASWLASDEQLASAVLFLVSRSSSHLFEQFVHRVVLPVQRKLPALLPAGSTASFSGSIGTGSGAGGGGGPRVRFLRLWMPVVASVQLKRIAASGELAPEVATLLPPRTGGRGKEGAVAKRGRVVREVVRGSMEMLGEEDKERVLAALTGEQAAWVTSLCLAV